MKKVLAIILVAVLLLQLSSCYVAKDTDKTFSHYVFSDDEGDFVSSPDKMVLQNYEKGKGGLYMLDGNAVQRVAYSMKNGIIYVGTEAKYYATAYNAFAIDKTNFTDKLSSYDETKGIIDYAAEIEGEVTVDGGKYTFTGGTIYGAVEQKAVGTYSIKNNYINMRLGGYGRNYILFKFVDKANVSRVGFSSDFYSLTAIITDPVEYTTFEIDCDAICGASGTISVVPKTADYKVKNSKVTLLTNNGNMFYVNSTGAYTYTPNGKDVGEVIIKVECDDLSKEFTLPVFGLSFDKSLLVSRKVGDTLDLSLSLYYILQGVEFKDLNMTFELTAGADVCTMTNGIITFIKGGAITVRVSSVVVVNDKNYTVSDEVSLIVSEG